MTAGDLQVSSFANDRVAVAITRSDGVLRIGLADRATGRAWGPVPLLAIDVHDNRLRRVERCEAYRIIRVDGMACGAAAMVDLPEFHITVSLRLRLDRDELVVELVPDECYERRPEVFRLACVEPMPGLLSVGAGNGRLFVPVNTGLVIDPAGKPRLEDFFLIYMEQERWELIPTLPVCGVRDDRGGMVVLASAGACDAQCCVRTDGDGAGSAGFAFSIRKRWNDPTDLDVRAMRYGPLRPNEDLVESCSRRVRRHAIEDHGKLPLDARRAESPDVEYLLGAYVMKLFHGIQDEGADRQARQDASSPDIYRHCMSFAEAAEGLRRLKSAGIDRIYTQCVGWNARGHDGLYPSRFPINERAGGEPGFRALIAEGERLGYRIGVHDNFMMNVRQSPDWDPECVTHDCWGEPLVHGWWAGGVEYATWPLALPDHRLEGHLRRMRGLGVSGPYYCDYMMQPLEVNYHLRHRGGRAACNRGMMAILERARSVFGSAGTEFATFPGVLASDIVSNPGSAWHMRLLKRTWPIAGMGGAVVPAWHLACSGLVVHEGHPGMSWRRVIEVVLAGAHPRDEWSCHPGHMPVLDDQRVAALAAIHRLCIHRLGRLGGMPIVHASWDGDQRSTEFADGTLVVGDVRAGELVVDGCRIERPAGLLD